MGSCASGRGDGLAKGGRAAPAPGPGPRAQTGQAYLEAHGRGLVAVHGDGGEAVQRPEHLAVERVPGHRGKLLGDGGLRAGADLLAVEPGREKEQPRLGYGRGSGARQGPGGASQRWGGDPAWALRSPLPSLLTVSWSCLPASDAGGFLSCDPRIPWYWLLQDWVEAAPQAKPRLNRKWVRRWMSDARHGHLKGAWRHGWHIPAHPAPSFLSCALVGPGTEGTAPHGAITC